MKLTDESPSRPSLAWTVTHNPAALWQALAPGLERWRSEWKPLAAILAVFLPSTTCRGRTALRRRPWRRWSWRSGMRASTCVVPLADFLHCHAIAVFVSQVGDEYTRPNAKRWPMASRRCRARSWPSARIRCCRYLPASIAWVRTGAGRLSTPVCAINVLAIILTASVLGPSLGISPAVGAVLLRR